MKNLKLSIIFIIIILTSCDMVIIDDFWYLSKGYNIKSMNDVVKYVGNITYKSDMDRYGKNYFQTPYETEVKKVGNCIDKCILGLALVYKYLNIKGKYYEVDTTGDGFTNHAMYSVNNKMYHKMPESYKIINVYEFDEVPYLASSKR